MRWQQRKVGVPFRIKTPDTFTNLGGAVVGRSRISRHGKQGEGLPLLPKCATQEGEPNHLCTIFFFSQEIFRFENGCAACCLGAYRRRQATRPGEPAWNAPTATNVPMSAPRADGLAPPHTVQLKIAAPPTTQVIYTFGIKLPIACPLDFVRLWPTSPAAGLPSSKTPCRYYQGG